MSHVCLLSSGLHKNNCVDLQETWRKDGECAEEELDEGAEPDPIFHTFHHRKRPLLWNSSREIE